MPQHSTGSRRFPIGAEVVGEGVHFRVWAPARRQVEVVVEGSNRHPHRLEAEGAGYFSGPVPGLKAGALYRYRLDGDKAFPDPASRFQPDGPHGPSQVVDPASFRWSDQNWRGCGPRGQVIYEMHIGTFTPEGTWQAAAERLPDLADLGVTLLEVMPVADFPGRFGWGYDGVDLFAPTQLYGTPDAFRAFVDRAHALGLGVLLDVVYNHLGPAGNYVREYSPHYFTDRYPNEWGDALNFDGPESGPVREYFIANAGYWIDEYHLDGLRLDATQQIFDASSEHILAAISREVRRRAGGRATYLVGENEPQNSRLVRPLDAGGYGLDALWNDDYHHSAVVALTGRSEAYYSDYQGTAREFLAAIKYGFLYQGQYYTWQKAGRGTSAFDLPGWAFVSFLENHDQVANSGQGRRCHQLTSPGRWRALTALTLLGPATPMLFQGQEFASSAPFLFFADHEPELATLVYKGRREFLGQFPGLATPEAQDQIDDPAAVATFERCKLDHGERQRHAAIYQLHRDLLRLRREDTAFHPRHPRRLDGAVLSDQALVVRFFGDGADQRLLLVNFGRDLPLAPAPEPLLAPPEGQRWKTLWTSEEIRYGGTGLAPLNPDAVWHLPGESAIVLTTEPAPAESPAPPA